MPAARHRPAPPERHHCIADIFVDDAAVRFDGTGRHVEVARDDVDDADADALRQACEAGGVGEHHRHLTRLSAGRCTLAVDEQGPDQIRGDELAEIGEALRHPREGARQLVELLERQPAVGDRLEVENLDALDVAHECAKRLREDALRDEGGQEAEDQSEGHEAHQGLPDDLIDRAEMLVLGMTTAIATALNSSGDRKT